MKIKEHLSVYLESGYLFDDMLRYVRNFIIINMKIDFIMRMGMCMLDN